jgi:hypothetical protein
VRYTIHTLKNLGASFRPSGALSRPPRSHIPTLVQLFCPSPIPSPPLLLIHRVGVFAISEGSGRLYPDPFARRTSLGLFLLDSGLWLSTTLPDLDAPLVPGLVCIMAFLCRHALALFSYSRNLVCTKEKLQKPGPMEFIPTSDLPIPHTKCQLCLPGGGNLCPPPPILAAASGRLALARQTSS